MIRGVNPAAQQPVHGAAYQKVRNDRQHEHNDDQLERPNAAQDDPLIEQVHDDAEGDDPADRRQAVAEKLAALVWVREHRPEVRRTPRLRIPSAVAIRIKHGHEGLKHETERERAARPAGEIRKKSREQFVHGLRRLGQGACRQRR